MVAAQEGHLAVVQWLAGLGGSVSKRDNDGSTPMYVTVYYGHLAVVQWLTGHGASVTQPCPPFPPGRTPAAVATSQGRPRRCRHVSHRRSVGQPSRSWWRAGSPTTPSSRSAPAGSTPVPAPPRLPSWSPPARAGRAVGGLTRRLSGHDPAGARCHGAPGRRLGTFYSTPWFTATSAWCCCAGTGFGAGTPSRPSCGG